MSLQATHFSDEFTGYTLFRYDTSKDELHVEKDCADLELAHSYPALDIFIGKGTEKQQFVVSLLYRYFGRHHTG